MYEITDYDLLYRPYNKSGGELKHPDFVKLPANPKGDGLQELLERKRGIEVFGIWCLLLEKTTVEKPENRGKLLNRKEESATEEEIARGISLKRKVELVKYALSVLVSMGWVKNSGQSEQTSANTPPNISKDKISKGKLREDKECIFRHWNSFKKPDKKWKTHTKITPDIERAIANALKDWSVEDVCAAVANFAKVVQGREFTWTYEKWGLFEFLNRRDKDDRTMYRWWRFQPSRFVEADWLTDDARRKRIETGKKKAERESPIKVVTAEEKQQIAKRKPVPCLDVKMKTVEAPMSDAEFQNEQAAQLKALKAEKKVGS